MHQAYEDLKDVLATAASQGCPVILCDQDQPDGEYEHVLFFPDGREPFQSQTMLDCVLKAASGYGGDLMLLGYDGKGRLRAGQYVSKTLDVDLQGKADDFAGQDQSDGK